MKKQVLVIHGGTTFEDYEEYLSFLKEYTIEDLDNFKRKDWKDSLQEKLGDDFEVIYPKMPNAKNAQYEEWKIWIEKIIPLLNDEVILVGHSMGGIFWSKYLSENDLPKKILGLFLVSAPFDDKDCDESLVSFTQGDNFNRLKQQVPNIYLYQSEDDPEVPFVDLGKYEKVLPKAKSKTFKDRGHFLTDNFPEIVEDIKSL